ncbi:MAG: acetyl-CoA carboxylase biotin carboxylase subunit [Chloroflexi bacterium]|nr:acetyl-CoA carboxylase biotin carboxylase subunit [Chloroflexota bacterium]
MHSNAFDKLLIANRGEIAVRIIRAARDLGIRTVAIYSEADRDALHTWLADEALCIGPPPAGKSYLNPDAIIAAAKQSGAQAIHPGYGFLAESAEFAKKCAEAGLIFVGPLAESIASMGDKALARRTAELAGVSTVPGTPQPIRDVEDARAWADEIGYPVMIKAAGGGGGRGIRVAQNRDELEQALPIAQYEAQAAFGNKAVYLEKFIPHARHVEVQILGDGRQCIHLFERECSIQRKRQKVVEEALSPCIDDEQRSQITLAAVRLANAVAYRGAGTLEFLVDPETKAFYFIEMNTRIQVEHPVTELVCGVDLVQEQIRVAAGASLRLRQEDVRPQGWAIECRINAENPSQNFMPHPGQVQRLRLPGGPWVRVDTALYEGYTIPPFYDSLIAKVIVWGETREEAIRRMRRALYELHIEGVSTTKSMLEQLFVNPCFASGQYHTNFLERWLDAEYRQA